MLELTVHTACGGQKTTVFPAAFRLQPSAFFKKTQTQATPQIRTAGHSTQGIRLAGIGGKINPGLREFPS
jgi:hypothetical protein